MKVSEVQRQLEYMNPDAEVDVIVGNLPYPFTITTSGPEGHVRANAETVSFYVDQLCQNEVEESGEA